jgi:hypothetical protein
MKMVAKLELKQLAYLAVAPALTLLSLDKAISLLYRQIVGSEAKTPSWLMWIGSSPGLCLVGVAILCLGGIPVFVVQGVAVRHVSLSRELLLLKFLWAWAHVAAYAFYKIWKIDDHLTRERESHRPSRMGLCLEQLEALRNHPRFLIVDFKGHFENL